MTMLPFGPGPNLAEFLQNRPSRPATSTRTGGTEGSRFVSAVSDATSTSLESMDIEQQFVAAGVDTTEQVVQGYIAKATADLKAAETEDEALQVIAAMQAYLPALAEKWPATPMTAYSQALEVSGFDAAVPLAPAARGLAAMGRTPADIRQLQGKNFTVQPDTGWMQYANGVLVDPTVPLGSAGAVVFSPDSVAPGSPIWLRNVQEGWSDDQISSWKSRLAEFGYITKDQAKTAGVDATFLDALRRYHEMRYQNGGTPLATDLTGGADGTPEFNLTARDFQAQIRNDVRAQYQSTFGNDPTDAELEDWTRFVTRSSLRAQKSLQKKGAPASTALSLAATNAEERLIEKLQGSPEATFLRESVQENTALRDALSTAVVTTQSLAG